MTRDETILELETMLAKYAFDADEARSIGEALTALRGPTREMVERMRGERKHYLPPLGAGNVQCRCANCGRTQMSRRRSARGVEAQ